MVGIVDDQYTDSTCVSLFPTRGQLWYLVGRQPQGMWRSRANAYGGFQLVMGVPPLSSIFLVGIVPYKPTILGVPLFEESTISYHIYYSLAGHDWVSVYNSFTIHLLFICCSSTIHSQIHLLSIYYACSLEVLFVYYLSTIHLLSIDCWFTVQLLFIHDWLTIHFIYYICLLLICCSLSVHSRFSFYSSTAHVL